MCVWTKKRGSMKAVVLMATSCPKSLHAWQGEKWIGRNILIFDDDDDVYYYICWRLKLEGETVLTSACVRASEPV